MSEPRVLLANHTGEIAGAERSLLDLLDGLDGNVEATVACPRGELFDALASRGRPALEIPGTSVSFRPHLIHTTRGLGEMAHTGLRLRRLARELGAPVIHANTERAGLCAALAGMAGGPAVVVHARAPFPDNRLGAITARGLVRGADAIVANSAYTAEQFRGRGRGVPVEVVHNPVDCAHFDPAAIDRSAARAAIGIESDEEPVLAVVGYLAPIKRQEDAIRILALVREEHPRACLVLAGATRFRGPGARDDTVGYADGLRDLAKSLGLESAVHFVGEREDVREVFGAADLLLVPSLREGFGRVALEGMAMGLPAIATSVGGTAEILRDGVDGLLRPPRDPEGWADAAAALLADPERRRAMGASARERAAASFSPKAHVDGVVAAYQQALAATGRRR
jgi:glycosyltransferase involved in cell wall biosynthesis